jgi:NADH-quinone oxidoreductase subunit A
MESYLPILVFALIAVLFLAGSLIAARLFRHGGSGRTNRDPYECGNEPESFALDHRFSIFPWAVMFDQLALFGFIEMMVFLAILVVGYVYVWNRGALNWA